jgi:hypothetical protein
MNVAAIKQVTPYVRFLYRAIQEKRHPSTPGFSLPAGDGPAADGTASSSTPA